MVMSFTIKKVIECISKELALDQFNNLKELELNKDSFRQSPASGGLKILIPDYEYGIDDNIVWYESTFIKGIPISNAEMESIVWPLCVMREDSFTINNYDRYNYIRCLESGNIYYIDLNDCYHTLIEQRKNKFFKDCVVI